MLAIYARISKKKADGKDTSIETQKKKGIELSNELNLPYEIFTDEGISGTKPIEERPAFAEMIHLIKKGKVTAVYCYDQSRIERDTVTWGLFQSIILNNNCRYFEGSKEVDLTDPAAQFIASVMSAQNKLYAQLTGKKVSASHHRRAERGIFDGQKAYGYKEGENRQLVIDDEEAKVIRQIFNESLGGNGAYTIAKKLNEQGIPTRLSKFDGSITRVDDYTGEIRYFDKKKVKWRGNVVHDMITNPTYKGEKWIKDKKYTVPAIIPPALWEKVNNNLKENRKNVGPKTHYKYLLNGLVECIHCGKKLVGKRRVSSRDNSYKCKGMVYPKRECTESRGINITKLESFILKHLFRDKTLKELLLNSPIDDSKQKEHQAELKQSRRLLKRKEKEIAKIYEIILDPELEFDDVIKKSLSTKKKEYERLGKKIKSTEQKLAELEPVQLKARTDFILSQHINNMDFDTIKKLVHQVIERIKIHHHKEEGKIGWFTIEITYRGFPEKNIFLTNWKATKFNWLYRFRERALTFEELRGDIHQEIHLWRYLGFMITPVEVQPIYLNDRELTADERNDLLGDILFSKREQKLIITALNEPEKKEEILKEIGDDNPAVRQLISHPKLRVEHPAREIAKENSIEVSSKTDSSISGNLTKEKMIASLSLPYYGDEKLEHGGQTISLIKKDLIDFI